MVLNFGREKRWERNKKKSTSSGTLREKNWIEWNENEEETTAVAAAIVAMVVCMRDRAWNENYNAWSKAEEREKASERDREGMSEKAHANEPSIYTAPLQWVKSTCWAINREIPQSFAWLWRVCVSSSFLCVVYMHLVFDGTVCWLALGIR